MINNDSSHIKKKFKTVSFYYLSGTQYQPAALIKDALLRDHGGTRVNGCGDSVFLSLQSGVLYRRGSPLLKLLPTASAPPIRETHCVRPMQHQAKEKKIIIICD